MKIYTALLKPDAEPVLVREGFSCAAMVFGPVWLAAHRAWVPAALSLAVYLVIWVLLPRPAAVTLAIGVAVIHGMIGQDLRCWALERRGYLLQHVLAATDRDDAFMRLMGLRPDVAVRYRPEPV